MEREIPIPNEAASESVIKIDDKLFTITLVGGDQLTVARIHGAQRIHGNFETSEQRFTRLLVVEDFSRGVRCDTKPMT